MRLQSYQLMGEPRRQVAEVLAARRAGLRERAPEGADPIVDAQIEEGALVASLLGALGPMQDLEREGWTPPREPEQRRQH